MSGSKFVYVTYIRITPREAVACTHHARDNKAVSVRNERRKRMEGRLHVENVR